MLSSSSMGIFELHVEMEESGMLGPHVEVSPLDT